MLTPKAHWAEYSWILVAPSPLFLVLSAFRFLPWQECIFQNTSYNACVSKSAVSKVETAAPGKIVPNANSALCFTGGGAKDPYYSSTGLAVKTPGSVVGVFCTFLGGTQAPAHSREGKGRYRIHPAGLSLEPPNLNSKDACLFFSLEQISITPLYTLYSTICRQLKRQLQFHLNCFQSSPSSTLERANRLNNTLAVCPAGSTPA